MSRPTRNSSGRLCYKALNETGERQVMDGGQGDVYNFSAPMANTAIIENENYDEVVQDGDHSHNVDLSMRHEAGETEAISNDDKEVEFIMRKANRVTTFVEGWSASSGDMETGQEPVGGEHVVKETPLLTQPEEIEGDNTTVPSSLADELTQAQLQERQEELDDEENRLRRQADRLAAETAIEAKERQISLMKKQITDLMVARQRAQAQPSVLSPTMLGDDPQGQQLHKVLKLLQQEETERQKQKQEEARRKTELEVQRRKDAEEERNKKMEEEERKKNEKKKKDEEKKAEIERKKKANEDAEKAKRLAEAEQKRKQEEEREKIRKQQQEEQERLQKEQQNEQERVIRDKIENEIRKEMENKVRKELEEKTKSNVTDTGASAMSPEMKKVLDWIETQRERDEAEAKKQEQLKQMQEQINAMARKENRQLCHSTGVNVFANLETIQGTEEGQVSLAQKAQAAMIAANSAAQGPERDPESEGESCISKESINTVQNRVKRTKKSGLMAKTSHRIKVETEWAHHNLGKEFEANPLNFNQLKVGHFVMGEAGILIRCDSPQELRSRLTLLQKIGYWQTKYEWGSIRNLYAAIMRGIEMGRETWSFDTRDYEDILVVQNYRFVNRDESYSFSPKVRKSRDTFFCAMFQKGECNQDSPHLARIGVDC